MGGKRVYELMIEFGHFSKPLSKKLANGYTHKWTIFVRGANSSKIEHCIQKVVFELHDSFEEPYRGIVEPPFQIKETGYAGFEIPIQIYFKNKDKPNHLVFVHDLVLLTNKPNEKIAVEKIKFINPNKDFEKCLIKAGAQLMSVVVKKERSDSPPAKKQKSSSLIPSKDMSRQPQSLTDLPAKFSSQLSTSQAQSLQLAHQSNHSQSTQQVHNSSKTSQSTIHQNSHHHNKQSHNHSSGHHGSSSGSSGGKSGSTSISNSNSISNNNNTISNANHHTSNHSDHHHHQEQPTSQPHKKPKSSSKDFIDVFGNPIMYNKNKESKHQHHSTHNNNNINHNHSNHVKDSGQNKESHSKESGHFKESNHSSKNHSNHNKDNNHNRSSTHHNKVKNHHNNNNHTPVTKDQANAPAQQVSQKPQSSRKLPIPNSSKQDLQTPQNPQDQHINDFQLIQTKISCLSDCDRLQKIVDIIEEAGEWFNVTPKKFEFDLKRLDKKTLEKIERCLL